MVNTRQSPTNIGVKHTIIQRRPTIRINLIKHIPEPAEKTTHQTRVTTSPMHRLNKNSVLIRRLENNTAIPHQRNLSQRISNMLQSQPNITRKPALEPATTTQRRPTIRISPIKHIPEPAVEISHQTRIPTRPGKRLGKNGRIMRRLIPNTRVPRRRPLHDHINETPPRRITWPPLLRRKHITKPQTEPVQKTSQPTRDSTGQTITTQQIPLGDPRPHRRRLIASVDRTSRVARLGRTNDRTSVSAGVGPDAGRIDAGRIDPGRIDPGRIDARNLSVRTSRNPNVATSAGICRIAHLDTRSLRVTTGVGTSVAGITTGVGTGGAGPLDGRSLSAMIRGGGTDLDDPGRFGF
ncbi:MAG: hypothetical protein ACQSGP_12055 [Frankia sp.]